MNPTPIEQALCELREQLAIIQEAEAILERLLQSRQPARDGRKWRWSPEALARVRKRRAERNAAQV